MKSFAAQSVTYEGDGWAITLQATIGPSERLVDNGVEMVGMVINEDLDFTVTADDLLLNGKTFKPCRGQRIKAVISGVERFYEVHPEPGVDAWSWTDSSKTRVRIHTKEIGKPA